MSLSAAQKLMFLHCLTGCSEGDFKTSDPGHNQQEICSVNEEQKCIVTSTVIISFGFYFNMCSSRILFGHY